MLKLYLNLCWNNYICIDEWMFISFHWHWYSLVDIKRATAWQNQQNDLCAQWRLRPAWSSAQSDQSSLCSHWVAKGPRFLRADSEDSDQTGQLPSLRWEHRPFCYAPPPESGGVLCYTLRNFECPSVRPSVCLSVRPSVRPSIRPSAPTTILVSATPPTVLGQSFWNFTGVLRMVWRYAYCFFRILKLFFITFFPFLT